MEFNPICVDPLVKGLLFSHESIEKKNVKVLLIYDLSKPVIRSAQVFFSSFQKSLRARRGGDSFTTWDPCSFFCENM